MSETVPFAPWQPDRAPLGTGSGSVCYGCLPRSDGWGPHKSFQDIINALPDTCRGYFFARRGDGSVAVFAGTSTRLYLLNNTDFTWVDMSKDGDPYSTLVPGAQWRFRQFNDLVIAVQVNTPPQKFALSTSTEFEDLGGLPPQAGHISIVNRFVVLTGLLSNPRRLQWCDLDAPETWTAGIGFADFQDLADGGNTKGLSGGDSYGVVFQEQAVRSLTYAPGSPVTFEIVKISSEDTLFAEYATIEVGDKTLYLSAQGFKEIVAGGRPTPIGKEQVDATFFADVDNSALQLIIGAADPAGTRVYWSYKSMAGPENLFDQLLVYDFALKRWAKIPQIGEYIASLAKPGVTLEALDPVAPTPLTVIGAADNGAGLIRLELNALSNANFNIAGQNFIVVYGVEGTTEANGTWAVDIIDSTHIDLLGSTFANAYTGGGQIGGSLDAIPFSLDSISKSAISELSIFNREHKAGFFSGPNMEAVMETADQDGKSRMLFVSDVLVLTDAAAGLISIGHRKRPQDSVTYTDETAINEDGYAPQLVENRYMRCRMRVPAAATWSYAQGVQPEGGLAGER